LLIKVPTQFEASTIQYEKEDAYKYLIKRREVFLNGRFVEIPYYNIEQMKNCAIIGPALLLSPTSSILLK